MIKLGQPDESPLQASTSSSVHSPNSKLNKEDLISSSEEELTSSAESSLNLSSSTSSVSSSRSASPAIPFYEDFMPDIRSDIAALTKVLEKITPPGPEAVMAGDTEKKKKTKPAVTKESKVKKTVKKTKRLTPAQKKEHKRKIVGLAKKLTKALEKSL